MVEDRDVHVWGVGSTDGEVLLGFYNDEFYLHTTDADTQGIMYLDEFFGRRAPGRPTKLNRQDAIRLRNLLDRALSIE